MKLHGDHCYFSTYRPPVPPSIWVVFFLKSELIWIPSPPGFRCNNYFLENISLPSSKRLTLAFGLLVHGSVVQGRGML